MAIYRGPGGSGDATQDAASEVLLAIQAKEAAQAAQAAAEAAQAAAETAQTAAELAETNAETAETNAETAETNAETAETNAETAQAAAEAAQTAAEAAQTAAETAETNAAASASAASTSASNASTSATNAASSASTATTQATNASNSASAAATSATNASNSASAASTSATNAANSATAAQTAETNAETAETNAAASASAASTSATNASNSASAASTSATNASNSASAASTSATNASNSASSASTSATNAASAQTAAESARDATLAAYDSFDDRYLGPKSSAPSLDNDGNALVGGALYFDTVSQGMKVYTGSVWVDAYVPGSTYLAKANNLSDLTNTGTARTNLGVAIGTDVQGYDAQLADIAGLTPSDNNFIVGNGTNFVTESGSTARTSLGLGTIATQDASNVTVTGGSINGTTIGATTATTGKFTTLEATGVATFSAGTVSAPAITTTGDTNTGIFFPAADTIAFTEGGVESMRIDSSGNVGIGTTSPTDTAGFSRALDLNGSAGAALYTRTNGSATSWTAFGNYGVDGYINNRGAGSLLFFNNNAERMRITSDGPVLINTTTAGSTLTVDTKQANYTDGIDISNSTQWGYGSSINFRVPPTSGGSLTTVSRIQQFFEASNQYGLGFSTYNAGLTERMRIHSNGYITMGTTNTNIDAGPGFKFIATTNAYIGMVVESSNNAQTNYHLYSTGAGAYRFYVGAGGTISATATTITAISDIRLKENIRDLEDGLNAVMALKPRKFDWKAGKGKDIKNDRGWIAQEFETVFPDMIEEWKDTPPEGEEPYKAVNANLIPTLVKAIQELKTELDTVKAELQTLKGN